MGGEYGVEPTAFVSPMMQGAIAMFEAYQSYKAAGFTEPEALSLVVALTLAQNN